MPIYCMGEKGEQILEFFKLNETNEIDYKVIFERARFLKRKQGTTETVGIFVTSLHNLVKN
jgi:hypothetical protein